MSETIKNPETTPTPVDRFNNLIQTAFDKFSDSVKESPRYKVKAVELAAPGINSALVTCDLLSGSPKEIIVMKPSDEAFITNEDYYVVHHGEIKVEHVRHNSSGRATIGFGTERSMGVEVVTDEMLVELETIMAEAEVHPDPQSKIFR